jgi:hypothetical protein
MKATGRNTAIERERRREDGEADLLGAVDAPPGRALPLLVDVLVDVLEHDDRVVDDDADREREGEHRDGVEREARALHEPKVLMMLWGWRRRR